MVIFLQFCLTKGSNFRRWRALLKGGVSNLKISHPYTKIGEEPPPGITPRGHFHKLRYAYARTARVWFLGSYHFLWGGGSLNYFLDDPQRHMARVLYKFAPSQKKQLGQRIWDTFHNKKELEENHITLGGIKNPQPFVWLVFMKHAWEITSTGVGDSLCFLYPTQW